MEKQDKSSVYNQSSDEELSDLRRGPWTVEEDFTLINYVAHHGEGRWNSLARSAGLKRTGKSCRLRWLNYLRPDVRRGNITLEEQLLILELHARWGNRWSKIAQHLPGRTDNEIKNYWRTRVQKHAKQLRCDVNSKQFKDAMRYLWMPRLVERIQATAAVAGGSSGNRAPAVVSSSAVAATDGYQFNSEDFENVSMCDRSIMMPQTSICGAGGVQNYTPENSNADASSESSGTPVSDLTECYNDYPIQADYYPVPNQVPYGDHQLLTSPTSYFDLGTLDSMEQSSQWMDGGDVSESLLDFDDMWFLQQQFNSNV